MGMRREDLAPALRMFTHQGYGIYYRNLDTEVTIERVLHPSLDVGRQSFDKS
jgi:plasmid stabilization system protein ParE